MNELEKALNRVKESQYARLEAHNKSLKRTNQILMLAVIFIALSLAMNIWDLIKTW
jgi:hypothetical protein